MKSEAEIKKILNDIGLNIVDWPKLMNYINIFSIERLIQDYCAPFVDPKTQKFISETNSNEIVSLIEFDKNLVCSLLKEILYFENKFKKIFVENWVSYYSMKSDKIYNFSDEELLSYMPNIDKCSDLKFSKFRYSLFEYASNSEFLVKYNSLSDIPLNELSYSWTFATVINFYRVLDIDIQKQILIALKINHQYSDIFHKVLNVFLKLRNMISHNHTIYDFSSRHYRIEYNKVFGSIFHSSSNLSDSISLDKIYLLLDYFLSIDTFNTVINSSIKSLNINRKSKEYIIKLMYGMI